MDMSKLFSDTISISQKIKKLSKTNEPTHKWENNALPIKMDYSSWDTWGGLAYLVFVHRYGLQSFESP